jgi:SAM-dependent methyltransferase
LSPGYHDRVNVIEQMRVDWNRRAKEDAHFYVAFGRKHQSEEEFLATAAETMPAFEQELVRLPPVPVTERRALEIGCGPGRLMLPMSRHFAEIHGVDISDEMAELARRRLRNAPHAHIHVTTGSDLSMLADDYFDFVYSYAVFQHIPDREVVLGYLREAQRVLKPGGVLRCQLRGRLPLVSELEHEPETWTGCHFSAGEMSAFAREHRFLLVALSGIDTQYMWATFRKPAHLAAARDPARVVLKAVTAASGAGVRVPARGREAAVSLWIDGFPENGDLAQFAVSFDQQPQLGCYLSPVSASGGCQLNAFLPQGLKHGRVAVGLLYDDRPVGNPHTIEVIPAQPPNPRVVLVTDGINLTTRFRSETGGVKVIMEELDRPEEVSFRVAGHPAKDLQFECQDPITSTYEFSFHLAPRIGPGIHPLLVNLSGRDLEPIALEVAFGEER